MDDETPPLYVARWRDGRSKRLVLALSLVCVGGLLLLVASFVSQTLSLVAGLVAVVISGLAAATIRSGEANVRVRVDDGGVRIDPEQRGPLRPDVDLRLPWEEVGGVYDASDRDGVLVEVRGRGLLVLGEARDGGPLEGLRTLLFARGAADGASTPTDPHS